LFQDNIELELKAFFEVLKGQGVGMNEPLVDAEGMPAD
jgi:Nas2 N_terminal domain